MTEEQTFLSNAGSTVTSSRVVINGQTFATRNIGSVAIKETRPNRVGPIVLILIGIPMFFGPWPVGVFFGAAGAIWLWVQSSTYRLVMMAGGGQVVALESNDGERVQELHDA